MGGVYSRLKARFRDQFTPVSGGWVYRRGGSGPALPLNDRDHAALVARFDRTLRWLAWTGVPVAALIWGLLDWQDLHPNYWVVALPFVAVFGGLMWWAWLAPHRLLDGRAPVARALTGGEARRDNLRTMPWSWLIVGALVSVGLAVRVLMMPDPFGPANRGYYGWAAAFLVFFAAMAWAKRRAG